jgi:hypothetical protein
MEHGKRRMSTFVDLIHSIKESSIQAHRRLFGAGAATLDHLDLSRPTLMSNSDAGQKLGSGTHLWLATSLPGWLRFVLSTSAPDMMCRHCDTAAN